MIIDSLIDLDLTQTSGQTSQPPWIKSGDVFRQIVMVGEKPVVFNAKQSGEYLDFDFKGDITQNEALSTMKYIYDLDFDLDKFYKYLSNHAELAEMSSFCRGLRLFLAPDPFECIISSICSANNSIKRWTKSISDIKCRWGCEYDGFYTFPDISDFSDIFLDDDEESDLCGRCDSNNLKSCGVGYRAPYMRKASQLITLETDLSEIPKMSYEEAFETVLELPGVGPKVADCILLYGFNFKEAFPSDVWIKRIVSHLYFEGKDISVAKIRDFGMEEFGEYAGYVQLYMFHYARKSGLMEKIR